VLSHHTQFLVAFTTNIAESNFRYTQVINRVAVAATASPAAARNTLRRVRVVGGLIMSISKVKALRASAEAVVFAKDVKHNVVHNCLCQPTSAENQAYDIRLEHDTSY